MSQTKNLGHPAGSINAKKSRRLLGPRVWLLAWILGSLGPVAAARAADSDAPIVLPAVGVSASILNVPVCIEYQRTPLGPLVHKVYVGAVKTPSLAQQAGLKEDMEIIAIQGTKVANLSETALGELLLQPAKDYVVLLVRRSWLGKPVEIRLPVPAD
jgi:hypothetical protein